MKRSMHLAASAVLFALSSMALAAGDPAAGKTKSTPCQACHGNEGTNFVPTDPQYPILAGQYRDYIVQALKEYKTGKRKNPIMAGFATPLTDTDINDLAAFFASLPSKLGDLDGRTDH